jgi:O-antigen/teichoic acid export membrane protein
MQKTILLIVKTLANNRTFSLFKHTLTYGIGDILQRFLSILLLPIYTRYLSPGDYGIIALLGIFGMIIGTLTMCGLTNGIGRFFFYTEQEETSLPAVLWSPFLFITILTLLLISIIGIFSGYLSTLLFDTKDHSYLVILTLLGILIGNLSSVGRSILIFQEKSKTVNYINIAGLAVGATSGIIFVVMLNRGVTGAVEAGIVGSAIMFIPIMILTMIKYKPGFSLPMLKKQLRFSLPLVAAVFAFWFIDSSDRYLLKVFLPLSEVGLYNVGYNIGLVMMILVGGFTLAWPPYYHRNNQNNEGQGVCDDVMKIYLLVTTFFVVVLSLAAPLAVRILATERFHQAYTVVPWVAMAYLLKGPYIILLMGVYIKNKTSWQLYLEGFAALVNLGLNILLIPVVGREAAALTTLFSYSIMVTGAYFMVMRINPIPKFSLGYALQMMTITFVIAGSVPWFANQHGYILSSIALFAVFIGMSLLFSYREFSPLLKEKASYI